MQAPLSGLRAAIPACLEGPQRTKTRVSETHYIFGEAFKVPRTQLHVSVSLASPTSASNEIPPGVNPSQGELLEACKPQTLHQELLSSLHAKRTRGVGSYDTQTSTSTPAKTSQDYPKPDRTLEPTHLKTPDPAKPSQTPGKRSFKRHLPLPPSPPPPLHSDIYSNPRQKHQHPSTLNPKTLHILNPKTPKALKSPQTTLNPSNHPKGAPGSLGKCCGGISTERTRSEAGQAHAPVERVGGLKGSRV